MKIGIIYDDGVSGSIRNAVVCLERWNQVAYGGESRER